MKVCDARNVIIPHRRFYVNTTFCIIAFLLPLLGITFEEETNANKKRPARVQKTAAGEQGCGVEGSVFAESVAGLIKLSVGPDPAAPRGEASEAALR